MYLEYNKIPGEFTQEELRHLSGALGFPKALFDKNLPQEYQNENKIFIKDLLKCIDERCFNVDLHYTVNLKSGPHNAKCLQKAVEFISKRLLSFTDLLNVRLAFQAYEEYDQKGMKIDQYTFLRALKMCGRVISPKKLMHKVKYLKSSYQEPGRIQLFEFLDLLTLCEYLEKYRLSDDLNSPVEKSWTKLYKIDNFKHFTTPKDKKLWGHLNHEYQEKELRYNRPELKSHGFVVNPLKAEGFRTQVKICNQKYEMLHRNLKDSNKQVQLAKGGFSFARPKSVSSNQYVGTLTSPKLSARSFPSVSARPSTPVSATMDDSWSERRHKPKRPQSSPPVVSKHFARDSKAKVDNVQFDICTEDQRWASYYLENISAHLPNYPEVLKRMRKPQSAPRRQRVYRRERPMRAIINKLANHETQPSIEHTERCDALVRGVGTDKHSMMLKNQAKKIRSKSAPVVSSTSRAKSASTSTSKRIAKYSTLLQTLMIEHGYVSDDDLSDVEAERPVEETPRGECEVIVEEATIVLPESDVDSCSDVHSNVSDEQVQEYKDQELCHDEEPESFTKETFLKEYLKWKQEKKSKIEHFLNESGYYRTFIKPTLTEDEVLVEEKKLVLEESVTSNQENVKPPDRPSEFELEIRNYKNIKIPHDILLFENVEDRCEKKRRMRSLKRISERLAQRDQQWFMTMARDQEKQGKFLHRTLKITN